MKIAIEFDQPDIENSMIVLENATEKILGSESGTYGKRSVNLCTYVHKLGLSLSVHERTKRIIKLPDSELSLEELNRSTSSRRKRNQSGEDDNEDEDKDTEAFIITDSIMIPN